MSLFSGISKALGGGLVSGATGLLTGFMSAKDTSKWMNRYKEALQDNIDANNDYAAKIASDARGYQDAAEGSMDRLNAQQNEQNRALEAMGASASSAAAKAQAQSDASAELASRGSQQTLSASMNAQNQANTLNNQIRQKQADYNVQKAQDVQKMWQGVNDSVNSFVSLGLTDKNSN